MSKEPAPAVICNIHNETLTIEHIMINCPKNTKDPLNIKPSMDNDENTEPICTLFYEKKL